MPELLRPAVYVEEGSSPAGVPLVATSTGAFIGVAERGPINVATFIDSFTSYWNTFGGYRSDSYLTYAVKGFFDNGGSRCYVTRVNNPDGSPLPAVADADLTDFGADATAYNIALLYEGAYGNYFKYNTTKFETTLTTAIPIGPATTAVLGDVSGIERGDVLHFDDGTDKLIAVVQSINLGTKTITFAKSVTAAAEIGATARVATSSQHRVTTTTSAVIPTGAQTQITVVNVTQIRVGQILTISDGTTLVSAVVTGINGHDVIIASATMTPGFAVGALVVSQEFILRVTDTGTLLPVYSFLSPSSTDKQDYVENRLSGASNESTLIEVTESSGSTGYLMIPLPVDDTALTGGADGEAPATADYIGVQVSKTGFYAFDQIPDINFLAAPGVTTTAIQQGGLDYAAGTSRQDLIFLVDAPSTSDTPEEIRDFRLNTLNRDTSFGALYYPWLQIADPEVSDQNIYVPTSGHVMGVYSAVARDSGPHTPPANISLLGVNGLMYDVSDSEHDILNPIGVNVIRAYAGQGIVIMGVRTLYSNPDGKHYVNVRTLTNFIKKSLVPMLRTYLMKAIDPSLWSRITNSSKTFMMGIWRSGWLYPSNDQNQAYVVKCDSENNTQDVINAGRVNVAVGFNPPMPAEFIVLRLSRIGSTVEVSE